MKSATLALLLILTATAASAQGISARDLLRSRSAGWLLTLTCGSCKQPPRRFFSSADDCVRAAQDALWELHINVPSYRCREVRP